MADKNIPLSELIRIGSKVTNQCTRSYAQPDFRATCAVGAAYFAKTGGDWPEMGKDVRGELGLVLDDFCVHPLSKKQGQIFNTITHLNDVHGWSRERIADWLESIGK